MGKDCNTCGGPTKKAYADGVQTTSVAANHNKVVKAYLAGLKKRTK